MFTWIKAALPTLTSVSFQFDTGKSLYTGTMTGTGFTAGSTANTELWIDGFKQVTTSVSSTVANFDITNTLDISSTNVQFYLPEGIPQGASSVLTSYSVNPQPVTVSPTTGSEAGSLITVSIPGAGINTSGITLVKASNTALAICSSVSIVSYGIATCISVAGTISDTIKIKLGTTTYGCISPTNCMYSTDSTKPAFSSVTSSASDITFSGSNFPTAGTWTAVATFGGVNSTSAVLTSSSSVVATFANGVPVSSAA
jgi:hypothetical protein